MARLLVPSPSRRQGTVGRFHRRSGMGVQQLVGLCSHRIRVHQRHRELGGAHRFGHQEGDLFLELGRH